MSCTCDVCIRPVAHSLHANGINTEAGVKLAEAFKQMPNLTSVK